MKFIHTADLHIGKFVNEFSMLKDQEYILNQMIDIIEEEQADGLIIAGDIYDRSIPPAEAVSVLDNFLSRLVDKGIRIFMISGNHDSPERIGFAKSIVEEKGLYIAGTYDGNARSITLQDKYGNLNIHLLPFVKPAVVKYYLQEDKIEDYHHSVEAMIKKFDIVENERNILLTHYFITSGATIPEISDSESVISVGGVDNVDASVFEGYDYVALGHIHRPQIIGGSHIRYAGSPIKYSFSEVHHKKSVTVIELKEKGKVDIRTRELTPIHNMRKIKGNLKELMSEDIIKEADVNDYIQATLTDADEIMDPIGTLRSVYPNTMQVIIEKNIKNNENVVAFEKIKNRSTIDIYEEFYQSVTGQEFDEKRYEVMKEIIEEASGEEV
ncbi:exonuclease SbcCD subunit D [Anaeromicropila herbilytica]|uniref:Nuclease SbcCD subunit D n=1 Tax=Anaeromicropila herbilytica TaxID=2785025 RepID=A0A7R7EJS1_9FIRM|nr:exonuclease SbcCD subunit D [Anaeromicropila herbilytica]BCN29732.1 nuclease SbcCD subunit D [Anaeromicropila herbilytica]